MLPVATTFIKVKKGLLIFYYFVTGFGFIVLVLIDDNDPNKSNSRNVVFAIIANLFFFVYWFIVSKIEIQLYANSIVYKNAFTTKEVYWNEIIESRISYEFTGHGRHSKWFFISPAKTIAFDNYYFTKKDKRLLAEVVIANCTKAKISNNIIAMANDKNNL